VGNISSKIEYGNVIHEILSFVKTKRCWFGNYKVYRKRIDHFGQKEIVFKTIQEIVNHSELEICFAEGNTVMNEQTIIQKKEMQSNRTV
jgi:hypothetical protein